MSAPAAGWSARAGGLAGVAALLLALAAACTASAPARRPSAAGTTGVASQPAATGTRLIQLGDRRFTLHTPESYDPAKPAPLVVLLHGYTATGAEQ